LKFRYRAIDRIPEPPSVAATRGTLVHSALERLFTRPTSERTPDSATEPIPQLWDELVARRPELADLIDSEALPAFWQEARELVETYCSLEDPRRVEPDGCEVRLEATIGDDIPTRGFVDRIDRSATGLIRIVDYKTGKAPGPRFESE